VEWAGAAAAHVSYRDETSGTVKYATNAGGAWQTSHLFEVGPGSGSSDLATDASDNVHIVYSCGTDHTLRYSLIPAAPWQYGGRAASPPGQPSLRGPGG
jgi:3-deoxy-D-arabino-heptulosonate 7-phosphate (DAHP) synthase